jgi:hypothetical protein
MSWLNTAHLLKLLVLTCGRSVAEEPRITIKATKSLSLTLIMIGCGTSDALLFTITLHIITHGHLNYIILF